MKKLLAIVLSVAIALVFAGCSGASAPNPGASENPTSSPTQTPTPSPTEPPLTLSMASAAAVSDTTKGEALEKGFEDLKTWSGGSMAIDLYESGEKGTDADIIEAVKSGGVSIYAGDASMMAAAIPQLAVLDLPMMFTKLDACNTMLGGGFTDMMQPLFNSAGMQLLGAYATSFRYLTASVPIAAAADFTGLRVSSSQSQYSQLFWSTLGCNVMPLERSQVYIALKQGMLEAQENTDAEISALELYNAQTSLIKTRHGQNVSLYVMNKAAYDALDDEQKGWLAQFVSQAEQDETAAVAEAEKEQETEFGKNKMTISEPSGEVLSALKGAVQPVIDAMKQTVDPALVDQYITACQQADGQTPAAPADSTAPTESGQASATP